MTRGRLARTSVLIGQGQLDRLRRISEESGVPIAVVVRRGVQFYLDAGGVPIPRWGHDKGPESVPGASASYAAGSPSHP